MVFIVLTRRAGSIHPQHLAGWLVKTARLAGRESLRKRNRRWRHETRAAQVRPQIESGDEPTVDQISPMLDDALARLNETDRSAVVMRFLQGRSFAEVGQCLNLSEEAARKRVERATEKLRIHLSKQGFTSSIGGLTVVLAAHQAKSAPTQLASQAGTLSAPGGAAASIAKGVALAMSIAKIQVAAVAIFIAIFLVSGVGIVAVHYLLSDSPSATVANPVVQRTTGPIQTNDRLSVKIDGIFGPFVSTFSRRVDSSGQIDLPLIGQIQAADLEPAAVEQLINKTYKDHQLILNAKAIVAFTERGDQISILSAPIHAGDHLLVSIHNLVGEGIETVLCLVVDGNGNIYLPYLRKIRVGDLTEFETEEKVSKAYKAARIFDNAMISMERISAKEFAGLDDQIKVQSSLLKSGDQLLLSVRDPLGRNVDPPLSVTIKENGTIDTPLVSGIKVAGWMGIDARVAVLDAYRAHHVWQITDVDIARASASEAAAKQ